jgi:hypothetical protein
MLANKPADVVLGEVVSVEPLEVKIDQKLILSKEFLVLSRNVTDFEIDMTVDHVTEFREGGVSYALFESHNHEYKGKKSFKVHNALKLGEKVIMLRMQGGQQFYIIDRVAE